MLIAREKKNSNIAEYLLYMWQLEDSLRGFDLDMSKINASIVEKYTVAPNVKKEIYAWYENIVAIMKNEHCEKSGHIQALKNIVNELSDLHFYLLQKAMDGRYRQIVTAATANLVDFRSHSGSTDDVSDVELALNAMYGNFILKLQGKPVSEQTQAAMSTFGKMLGYLAAMYKKMDEEESNII